MIVCTNNKCKLWREGCICGAEVIAINPYGQCSVHYGENGAPRLKSDYERAEAQVSEVLDYSEEGLTCDAAPDHL